MNVVGILPGKNYKVKGKQDKILLIGSHYDTVFGSPGVDDNGSGMVALLAINRLLHENGIKARQLNHTVMFVAFDLEEHGLIGSRAFVRDWLIRKFLLNKDNIFLGAYIFDVNLLYDPTPGSQYVPDDVRGSCQQTVKEIEGNGAKGDFTVMCSRAGVDDELVNQMKSVWPESKYKLQSCGAPITEIPPSFSRSDHYSFWFHSHPVYKKPLRAVFLTDMGPFRGKMVNCYHRPCDNTSLLTKENLNFLKTTIDSVYQVVVHSPPTPSKI